MRSEETEKFLHLDCTVDGLKPVEPLEAAIRTINSIVASYPPPYNLMVSGGIDSQAMIFCWLQSGVDFNIVSARYNTDMNAHDLEQLQPFATMFGLDIKYVDIDLIGFLKDEYHDYATTYRCTSPQICTHMKIAETVEGTAVFSGNFIQEGKVFLTDALLGLKRFAEKSERPIVPFFFLESPELAYSLMPIHSQYSYDETNYYEVKIEAYRDAGFPVIPQTMKFTGFELAKDYYDEHFADQVTVQQRLEFANKPSKRTFDLLLRYPYEKLLGERIVKAKTNLQ
jgi:hypothetical protein